MQINRVFEPSDIKIGENGEPPDKLHVFILAQLLIAALSFQKRPGEGDLDPVKRNIAAFLTSMEREGWVMTRAELPAVYKEL